MFAVFWALLNLGDTKVPGRDHILISEVSSLKQQDLNQTNAHGFTDLFNENKGKSPENHRKIIGKTIQIIMAIFGSFI